MEEVAIKGDLHRRMEIAELREKLEALLFHMNLRVVEAPKEQQFRPFVVKSADTE